MRYSVRSAYFVGFVGVLVLALAAQSRAAIQIIPTPTSVELGELESDDTIWGFLESSGNGTSQSVNVVANGSQQTIDEAGDLTGGTVTAPFDSWFFHFEPDGDPSPNLVEASGTYTFSTKILGVIVTDALLDGTDVLLGSAATTYSTGEVNRGLEWTNYNGTSQDQVTISLSDDDKTISFDWVRGGNKMDQVRVLTAAVPEPTTLAIWGMFGGLGLIAARRRRRAA